MNTFKVTFDLSGCISHIGSDVAGIGVEDVSEWAHSDTLFSALIHTYSKKYGFEASNTLIKAFTNPGEKQTEPPFRCSSFFLGNQEKMFFPKPKKPLPDEFDWTQLYKIKYISLENLLNWLEIQTADWTTPEKRQAFIDNVIEDDGDYKKLFLKRIRAVNSRDRLRNQTSVFHRGEVLYTPGTKGFFFMDIPESRYNEIKNTIQYLADFGGIGGELSIGFSQMKLDSIIPFSIPNPGTKSNVYLLSLYPIYPEIDWKNAYYDILNRKSWMHSPYSGIRLKKRAVKMLIEGSCLPTNLISGELINVSPGEWKKLETTNNWHPIHRNGIGFALYY